MSMVWAQLMPFVALLLSSTKDRAGAQSGGELEKSTIAIVLACSFAAWFLLNIAFFCTIDLSFSHTFFGFQTASQYTQELFLTSKEDPAKFRAAFKKRSDFTSPIRGEIKAWVGGNIERWRAERPAWFDVQLIPDELLPASVLKAEGGPERRRRRSSVSLHEAIGGGKNR